MRINLKELEKSYTRVYYTNKKLEVFVIYKLVMLELRVLINCNCLLS